MGLVQEARRGIAGVFRRQMRQPTSAVAAESPPEPKLTVIPSEIVVLDATEKIEPRRNVYGRGRKATLGKLGKLPAGILSSAVGNDGLAKVVDAKESKEPKLREEISLAGAEARADLRPAAVAVRRPQDKTPELKPEEMEDLRTYDIERLYGLFNGLQSTTDSVRGCPQHVIAALMFIHAVATHKVGNFDPTEDSYSQVVARNAVATAIVVLRKLDGRMEYEPTLFGLFQKVRTQFTGDPEIFWRRKN